MESDAEEDLAMPHVSGGVIEKVRKIFACVWSYRKILWTTKIILTSLECLGEMSLNNLNPLAYSSQHKFTATGIVIVPPPPSLSPQLWWEGGGGGGQKFSRWFVKAGVEDFEKLGAVGRKVGVN